MTGQQTAWTPGEWTNAIIGMDDALVGEMAEAILALTSAFENGATISDEHRAWDMVYQMAERLRRIGASDD